MKYKLSAETAKKAPDGENTMREVKPQIVPAQIPVSPANVTVQGIWGQHLNSSIRNWMLSVDDNILMGGFRHKPGIQAWVGEHLGKFVLGALPTAYMLSNGKTAGLLKAKIEKLIKGLVRYQETDGYLGTYPTGERWFGGWPDNPKRGQEWDLWVHKYCILALLAYHAETGWQPALTAARRAADCVIANIGVGKQAVGKSDGHAGLASGSILEPIMLLYQKTGEARYLEFARYIVREWDEADNPRIVRVLRERSDICTIGRGKAYEMLSCFVGLLEYAVTTGEQEYLQMLLDARDRIADTQRYPTGGISVGEYFKLPGRFPEHADIETCVTFTWIQFNLRLFAATGDCRALELAEESILTGYFPPMKPDMMVTPKLPRYVL